MSFIPKLTAQGEYVIKVDAFASRDNYSFQGEGAQFNAIKNASTSYAHTITQNECKLSGLNLLNGAKGDIAKLTLLDDTSGTYSGTPNLLLKTFVTTWNCCEEVKEILPYTADLQVGMQIVVEYTNNDVNNDRTIYLNYYLHEVT